MGLFEKNQGTTNMLVLAITKERKGELVIGGKSEADLKYASILHRTPIGSQSQTHRGLCNMMNIGPRAPPPSPPVHCERKGMGLGWEGRREVALLSRSVVISLLKEEVTTPVAKRQLEKVNKFKQYCLRFSTGSSREGNYKLNYTCDHRSFYVTCK